jgi:hypothetical protein
MAELTSYHIFSGTVDHRPLWLESVRGRESAFERMKERAEHAPGPYFVFDSMNQTVLAFVDTSSHDHRQH